MKKIIGYILMKFDQWIIRMYDKRGLNYYKTLYEDTLDELMEKEREYDSLFYQFLRMDEELEKYRKEES